MASIREVAERARVSTATVSRALRGLPSVAASTRARVERAASDLGYVLPFNASSLASGRTNLVGVIVPHLTRWFFGTAVSGVERVLGQAGLDMVLYSVGAPATRQRLFAQLPMRRRVDAVIVLGLPLTGPEAEALRKLRVPVVLVGSEGDGFGSVRIDDAGAASTAVDFLISLGHNRIGLIGEQDPAPMGFTTPDERRCGYLRTLCAAGIEPDPRWQVSGEFTVSGGERAMTELLACPCVPTAVFAMSDEMAFGALRALRHNGLSVPGGLSLVGFDDHELAKAMDLTTMSQPVVQQGAAAAEMVLAMMSGKSGPKRQIMRTELVERASAGPVVTSVVVA